MPPATELLVHISAPCGVSDDARYRKEAQEYLLFKSVNRRSLCWPDSSVGDGTEAVSSAVLETAPPTTEDNETKYSNVNLSSLKTPGRIPQRRPKVHVARTPLDCRPQTAPSSTNCIKETPFPFLHRRSQSDSWEQPSSFIPDSQPSNSLGVSLPKRRHHSRSLSPSSLLSSPSSKRRRRISPLRVGPAVDVGSSLPSSERQLDWKTSTSFQPLRSILTPPPRPSHDSFKTYITPPLALITAHLPLPAFYFSFQAQPPYRQLETHERGHWALSISSFSVEHKTKVWTYLEKFIGAGRAGRVSCFLEELKKDAAKNMSKELVTGQSSGARKSHERVAPCEAEGGASKEEFLKVYCMGEAVPSIWLLLFIATTRQIKGRRAQWIDASGTIVIQMQ